MRPSRTPANSLPELDATWRTCFLMPLKHNQTGRPPSFDSGFPDEDSTCHVESTMHLATELPPPGNTNCGNRGCHTNAEEA